MKNKVLKTALKAVKYASAAASAVISAGIITSFFPAREKPSKGRENPLVTKDGALVAAHRSGASIAPENTLMAFEKCAESNDFDVDLFEFDVHLTKDDELIVLHDKTLDRTSNAREHFGEKDIHPETKTFDEISELNFGENYVDSENKQPFKGLRLGEIPDNLKALSLDKLLEFLESKKGYLYSIDIKNSGEIGKKAVDKFYEVLKELNLFGRVILASFNGDVSKYVDENYPEFNRSASVKEALAFYFACAFNIDIDPEKLKFRVLQIPSNQYKIFRLGTKRLIDYAHRYNIAVQYWT
ncbi:MAG: glycerophosphodiester phosphodiesterase family protein, partial [Acutalibacteraceae bacterium]